MRGRESGSAALDDGIDDSMMGTERPCQYEPYALVRFCCLRHQAWKVFPYVAPRRQHEGVCDDDRGALLDATRKALGDRRFGNLHVCGFDDGTFADASLHLAHDIVQQRVGFFAAAAVVDQEKRLHRTDLGLHRKHVNLDVGGQGPLDRAQVRTTEEIDMHEKWIELIEGHPTFGPRRERHRFVVGREYALVEAAE